MKLSRIDMFWGCLLIAVGIGFFGDSLHLWNFEFFFCGWWTLFIIVPSLCNILEEGVKRLNVIGLSVLTKGEGSNLSFFMEFFK